MTRYHRNFLILYVIELVLYIMIYVLGNIPSRFTVFMFGATSLAAVEVILEIVNNSVVITITDDDDDETENKEENRKE